MVLTCRGLMHTTNARTRRTIPAHAARARCAAAHAASRHRRRSSGGGAVDDEGADEEATGDESDSSLNLEATMEGSGLPRLVQAVGDALQWFKDRVEAQEQMREQIEARLDEAQEEAQLQAARAQAAETTAATAASARAAHPSLEEVVGAAVSGGAEDEHSPEVGGSGRWLTGGLER